MCQNSAEYAACWADTQHWLLQSIKRDISKKVGAKIDDKQFVAGAKPKMSAISRVRQQELLQSCEDASDYFCCDWLTCQQLSNHQQLQREEEKKRNLSCGDPACLFYGLIFVGHDAEGTLQRKEFLTICQGGLSGDACYWNGDIFNSFKDSSGHLLCHWKWSLALLFELTVWPIQVWQAVVWFAKGCWI